MKRLLRVVLLGGALVVPAGCGGPGKTTEAANIVPPGVASYLQVRTSQLPRATALLARFPARGEVLREVPRLPVGAGPETDIATLAGGRVFYTQPADEKAFAKRLDATGLVHARIRGWTVFAASRALLAAVEHRRGSLAGERWYTAAAATLPSHAALGELVPGWRATALTVRRSDAELEVHRTRPPVPQVSSSALATEVPADAIAAAGVAGPLSVPRGAPKLLHELAAAVDGPAVVWVRPDSELPEVTVVAKPADAPRALRATAAFVAQLTKNPVHTAVTVDGVPLAQVASGAIDVYYGLVDGRLVLTDSAPAAARVAAGGKGLPAVSWLPGSTESWAYANVPKGLPLALLFAGLFDAKIPKTLATRLAPVRDVLVAASHEGRVATVVTRVDLR